MGVNRRTINLDNVTGMDLREQSLDTRLVKELVNLKNGKSGWEIRQPRKDVYTLTDPNDSIKFLILSNGKAVVQINRSILFYTVVDDVLTTLIDRYDFSFDFKLYNTVYLNTFILLDTSNNRNYVCEFTDRLLVSVNDAGDQEQSTELLLNEMDAKTKDNTWGFMAKYPAYDSTASVAVVATATGTAWATAQLSACVKVSAAIYATATAYATAYADGSAISATASATATAMNNIASAVATAVVTASDGTTASAVSAATAAGGAIVTIMSGSAYLKPSYLGVGYKISANSTAYTVKSVIDDTHFYIDEMVCTGWSATAGVVVNSYTPTLHAKSYANSVSKYLIDYDSGKSVLLLQRDYCGDRSRYVMVTYFNAKTHVYVFAWDDDKPEVWSAHYTYNGDIFGDAYSKYMDIESTYSGDNQNWDYLSEILFNIDLKKCIEYKKQLYIFSNDKIYKYTPKNKFQEITINYGIYTPNVNYVFYNEPENELWLRSGTYSEGFVWFIFDGNNVVPIEDNRASILRYIHQLIYYHGTIYALGDGNYSIGNTNKLLISKYNYSTKIFGNNIYVGTEDINLYMDNMIVIEYDDEIYAFWHIVDGDELYNNEHIAHYSYLDSWLSASWNIITTPEINTTNSLCGFNGSLYLGGGEGSIGQVHIWNGSVWAQHGSDLTDTLTVNSIIGFDGYLYAGCLCDGGGDIQKYDSGWSSDDTEHQGTGVNYLYIPLVCTNGLLSITNNGVVSIKSFGYNLIFNIYYSYANKINKMAIDETTETVTVTTPSSNTISCKCLKTIEFIYNSCYLTYLAVIDSTNKLDVYLITKTGDAVMLALLESASVSWGTPLLSNQITVTNLIGLHKVYNKAYTDNQKGWSLIIAYNNRARIADLYLDSDDEATDTLAIDIKSEGVKFQSDYEISGQAYVTGNLSGFIVDADTTYNFYILQTEKAIKYKITGEYMTYDDTLKSESFYTYELAPYGDWADGGVTGGIVSNPKGYVLTEINKSMKPPVRPYFTVDAGDTLWAADASFHKKSFKRLKYPLVYNGSEVTDPTVTVTLPDGSKWRYLRRNRMGFLYWVTESNNAPIDFVDSELFLRPSYPNYKDTANFTTPLDIGNGTSMLPCSDDAAEGFKYWMIYLLGTGLFDEYVPYIELARGVDGANGYNVSFWKDLGYSIYEGKVTVEADTPLLFSNPTLSLTNSQEESVPTEQTFIINNKIFYKIGDAYRDDFTVSSIWEQFYSSKYALQDLIYRPDNMLMGICRAFRGMYYSKGLKFLNRLNYFGFLSLPSSICEISGGGAVIACDNHIYASYGSDAASIVTSLIINELGLEKDNYLALVSDGLYTFVHNRQGLFMIHEGMVTDIGLPMADYLVKQSSGNVLGIDPLNGQLFVPLENTAELSIQTQNGDYGTTADQTVNWDRKYGVFDYKNLNWRIYSYENTDGLDYLQFFANMGDHMVMRVEDKLIIPEYTVEAGTENPLCRFETRKMSIGNIHGLVQLYDVLASFVNGGDYGIDYFRVYLLIDNVYELAYKYGDFDGTAYTDTQNGNAYNVIYNAITNPTAKIDADYGITDAKLPIEGSKCDFRTIGIRIEFGRIGSNRANVSLREVALDTIDKFRERTGLY